MVLGDHAWMKERAWSSSQLENAIRKIIMAARTTGNTKSKGIPGGEGTPIKSGPNTSMATMIKNITMEP